MTFYAVLKHKIINGLQEPLIHQTERKNIVFSAQNFTFMITMDSPIKKLCCSNTY